MPLDRVGCRARTGWVVDGDRPRVWGDEGGLYPYGGELVATPAELRPPRTRPAYAPRYAPIIHAPPLYTPRAPIAPLRAA
jgi:hypothetical protein